MEQIFIPIVIPVYYMSAGLALYTAIHSLIFVSSKDRVSLNVALALLSLFIAGFQISNAAFYQATTVVEASFDLKVQIFFFLGAVSSCYAFVAVYTECQRMTRWLILLVLVSAVLLALNFYSPHSLRFITLETVAPIRMPWGETLRQFSGTASFWNWVIRFMMCSLYIFIGWRSIILYRQKKYVSAQFLGLSAVLFILAAIWGVLIELGKVHSIYLGGFVFVFLMILMSISLAQDRKKDVTELKRTAELIRLGEMELNSIFRAAPVAVALIKNRVLVKVTDFMCNMVGYTREELIGQSLRKFYIGDEEFERVGREFYSSIKKFGVATNESGCRIKNGDIITLLGKGVFLDPNDESAGYVAMAMDITERKK
ncbi:MAG: PAS domain-containing protein, partial [Nitrospiria bacterium]